jgi:NAD(P)-dependent dehydrogenase (short-subunit alcohol dehydrogenase family)
LSMSDSGFDISGKVVFVTGGTSGIGKAIALGCAQAGAKVIAGSTNPDKVSAIREELKGIGASNDATSINVADEASVKSAFEFAVARGGRLDAVIHSAGVIKKQPSLEMPIAEFRRIIDVNLTGTFIVNQAAARVMKEQSPGLRGERGSIVNIASINSFISLIEVLAYGASKCGVIGIIRGLANEWAQYGIRVNGVAPGVVETDLNRKLINGTPRGDFLKAHTPQGRFGTAEEMVGAAIYLISPAASHTNGHTMIVDGGFLTRGVGV